LASRSASFATGWGVIFFDLYGLGMSYGDIRAHMKKVYGTELSDAQLSHVTDSVQQEMEQWRNRPLANQ